MCSRLMIFGKLQESDVWDYWSYCGEIDSMDMMRFPDTGRFKGIVFITFKTVIATVSGDLSCFHMNSFS
jgi:hypothetical protein